MPIPINAMLTRGQQTVYARHMDSVFQRLVSHFKTQAAIARAFGVSPQAVTNWKRRGVPNDRALDIENETDGKVPARDVLREARPQ